MEGKKRNIASIVGMIIIAIILIAVFSLLYNYASGNRCNYNNPNMTYIKKSQPCVINFLCTKDKQAFSDSCGCGCKTAG